MKKLKTFFASLALSCVVLLPTLSQANIELYARQVAAQLALYETAAEYNGWSRSHDRQVSGLRQGESETFNLNLRRNYHYKIMSFCDGDCGDLDLVLYNENGDELASDFSTDSVPVVNVSPSGSGRFRLKVTMYNCKSNPCLYGITTMAK